MKKLAFLIIIVNINFLPSFVLAENELPEPLVGQTEARQTLNAGEPGEQDVIYYGATTGNETVYNYGSPGKKIESSFGPSLFLNKKTGLPVNTYVDILNNTVDFNNGMTIAFWFYPTTTEKQTILSAETSKGVFELGFESGTLYADTCGKSSCKASSAAEAVLNSWNYFVVTYSPGDKDIITFYVINKDNLVRQIGSRPLNERKSIGDILSRYNMGRLIGATNYYKGGIDEFKIYNYTVSSANFVNIMNGLFTNGLSDYWDFSGRTTRIQDISESGDSNGLIENSNYEFSDNAPTFERESGTEPFGFDQNNLIKCVNGIIIGKTPDPCFKRNLSTNAIDIMTSRTYYNNTPGLELAVLSYTSKNMVIGDSFLGNRSLSDFSYWGKHLATTRGLADTEEPMWGVGGYRINDINPDAQTSLSGKEFEQYKNKIILLKGEGTPLSLANITVGPDSLYYLQHDMFNAISTGQSDKYPEGKIWKFTENQSFNFAARNYTGVGTIIVDNGSGLNNSSLSFNDSVQGVGDNDMLGIIVFGNVTIPPNSKIKASIFATGTITVGANAEMIGSFVASDFSIAANSNIRIRYDERLINKMPPGFGFLNMPKPQ